jgi:hypothetical protein
MQITKDLTVHVLKPPRILTYVFVTCNHTAFRGQFIITALK